MPIVNKNRYPRSEFVSTEQIKPFVEVEGNIYVLVGYEDGNKDTPLVASASTSTPATEDLHATPLYELLKFAQGEVKRLN